LRLSRLLFLCFFLAFAIPPAWGQASSTIRGQVTDPSGGAVSGATVLVTNTTTGATVRRATTGVDGTFQIDGLAPLQYLVTVVKPGFEAYSDEATPEPGKPFVIQARLLVKSMVQTVEVHSTAPGATAVPTQQDVFKSPQTLRVLSRKQIDAAGPLAGAGQIVAQAPGANVVSYGATGGTKSTIMLNGINQGWGGYGGYNYPGSLGVTLDGIPIVDAGSGLWPSASLPQTKMFQNVNVIYGPGDPADRWYTNVGGSFNFVPMEPTSKAHMDGTVSFGSYNQKNLELNLFTGDFRGWSTVVSGGLGKGDSFRQAADGFKNPDKNGAIFVKTSKSFTSGAFSIGGYYARSGGYRAQIIPTTDVPGLTVDGLNVPGGAVYSQPSSGFYSTLPYSSYNKYDVNELGVIYAKEMFLLDDTTAAENDTWFTHEFRMHERNDDVYADPAEIHEWNNPHHNTVGDRFVLSKTVRHNKVSLGGYFLHDIYNSRNNFYNPALGGSGKDQIVNIGGKVRSSYFIQDNFAAYVQDDFRPIPQVHITPGVRFDRYATDYYSGTLQDFSFAPGVVLSTHCPETGTSTPGNTKDQGASCGNHQARTAIEPSINASVQPVKWLTLYGGFARTDRSPSLGGGGGLFQSLDPTTSYLLAVAKYYQAGFKVHMSQRGALRNVLFGAAYYHLKYNNEQLGVELGNGNFINTSGSSHYQGVNAYMDFQPTRDLHLYTNLNGEAATYDQFYAQNPVSGSNETFQGLPVSYVPAQTWNTGGYYDFQRGDRTLVEPKVWFQYVGSQHIFDNCVLVNGACTNAGPSQQNMPSYETVNLSLTVPYKFLSFDVNMLNLFDKKYNIYEYISSGGYFGTSTGGYTFAYPGAPFTVYASLGFHF
jgi:iron complex outermembrane receptor protein